MNLEVKKNIYQNGLKRLLDISISVIALVLLFPVFLIVAIFIFTKLGRPIFFTQERPGKNGKIFKMYKFRTMTNERDASGALLPDGERLLSLGKFLRSSSLDELPELVNIIKGNMSIVGPRPLLVSYLPLYTEEQMDRHLVRPGLTGLAQINGRNLISWEEKFLLDRDYVATYNFFIDVKIICLTFVKVLKKEGISANNHETIIEFKGKVGGE